VVLTLVAQRRRDCSQFGDTGGVKLIRGCDRSWLLRGYEGAEASEAIERCDNRNRFVLQGQLNRVLRIGRRWKQACGPAFGSAAPQNEKTGIAGRGNLEHGRLLLAEQLAAWR